MTNKLMKQIKGDLGLNRNMDHITVVNDAKAILGEGCLWDNREQVLWWVDINGYRLHQHNPATGENKSFDVGSHIGTVGLRESGGLIIATAADGFAGFDPNTEATEPIAHPEADLEITRYNDGKPGPNGSFFCGSMGFEGQQGVGSLYRLDVDHTVEKIASNITVSNGMAWNAAEDTMYYIDTPNMAVEAFDYDKSTGAVGNRRTVITIPEGVGYPDGMTIDNEDKLWVSHWDGQAVHRWDPITGRHLHTVPIPATKVTCCTFGGRNFDTLYVTSARIGLEETELQQQPLAGGLFSVQVGQSGRPAYRYKG